MPLIKVNDHFAVKPENIDHASIYQDGATYRVQFTFQSGAERQVKAKDWNDAMRMLDLAIQEEKSESES